MFFFDTGKIIRGERLPVKPAMTCEKAAMSGAGRRGKTGGRGMAKISEIIGIFVPQIKL